MADLPDTQRRNLPGSPGCRTRRIAIICDNFSPHLTTAKDAQVQGMGHGEQRRDRLHPHQIVL
jgi:hypothetical protein